MTIAECQRFFVPVFSKILHQRHRLADQAMGFGQVQVLGHVLPVAAITYSKVQHALMSEAMDGFTPFFPLHTHFR